MNIFKDIRLRLHIARRLAAISGGAPRVELGFFGVVLREHGGPLGADARNDILAWPFNLVAPGHAKEGGEGGESLDGQFVYVKMPAIRMSSRLRQGNGMGACRKCLEPSFSSRWKLV